jgi:hypothetical protein
MIKGVATIVLGAVLLGSPARADSITDRIDGNVAGEFAECASFYALTGACVAQTTPVDEALEARLLRRAAPAFFRRMKCSRS